MTDWGRHLRIVFMGTPDFAVPSLDALVAAGHDVVAAYTQPPRRAGRGKALSPSPVQRRAEALGIAVRHPEKLRDPADQAAFAALDADVAVVAAYGLILPQAILDAPKHGCINVHGSLLPRWRGAAPVQRAILAGDSVTGVTIMQMEAGLDTGPMLATIKVAIASKTAGVLTRELAEEGAKLLISVLADLPGHPPILQPADGVTYASKIEKREARLDFFQTSIDIEAQIRAFNPAPGAFFEIKGERIRVLHGAVLAAGPQDFRTSFPSQPGIVLDDQLGIGCADGAIRPTIVQRAGRSIVDTWEFLRGFPIPAGTRLS